MGNCLGHGSRENIHHHRRDDKNSAYDFPPKANNAATVTAAPAQPSPPSNKNNREQATTSPLPQPKPSSRHAPTIHSITANVLGKPLEDVRAMYVLGRELGRGQFGVTHLCTDRASGKTYACKTIAKRKLISKADVEDVKREVQIMHHLRGNENIVELRGSYEDKHSVHLVMELCEGGELFDRIIARGHYSERAAAALCRTIVRVVYICHSLGVMHRDLKPENFLLADKSESAPLKATDFGLSVFFKHGDKFTDLVGSAYYVAPEVLRRNYGPEADVWSAGVILYILLSGVPPFWAESEQGIFDAVLRGQVDFVSDPWPSISSSAKDLVKKMLTQDVKKRVTAAEVLSHPWVREDGDAPDAPLDNAVLSRMKQFTAMNKLKKLALKVIAASLSEEEITGLKEMFSSMDTDGSGTITFDELKAGLERLGSNLRDAEIRQIMNAADVDGNGTIDYLEFITATMQMNKMQKEDHLYSAFQFFDNDNSGYITMEELEEALVKYGMGDHETMKEILKEVDTDNDGKINYDEFAAMMTKGAAPSSEQQNNRRKGQELPVGAPRHRK